MGSGIQANGPERRWTDEALRRGGHRPTTPAEWAEHGEPERFALDPDRIAGHVVAARAARRRLPRAADLGEVMAPVLDRASALGAWAVVIAEGAVSDETSPRLSDVRVWRWHYLGGAEGRPVKLLAERDVDGWILERWAQAPVGGWFGPDGTVAPFERLSDLRGLGGVSLEWRRRVGRRWEVAAWSAPAEHTALAELARLAASLARRFSWDAAEATMFVLCGTVPAVEPIRGHLEVRDSTSVVERSGVRPRGLDRCTVDGFARVVVELDPALTPEQLAAWWRQVRSDLEPVGGWPAPSPARNELARWLATAGEGSWSELHARWNGSHAGHQIGARGNFARMAKEALRRLLGPGIGQRPDERR